MIRAKANDEGAPHGGPLAAGALHELRELAAVRTADRFFDGTEKGRDAGSVPGGLLLPSYRHGFGNEKIAQKTAVVYCRACSKGTAVPNAAPTGTATRTSVGKCFPER